MPIKKSALLLIVLSLSSVSLLVFSSDSTPAAEPAQSVLPTTCVPAKGIPTKCCIQLNEPKTFSPWDLMTHIMLRSAA